MKVTYTGKTVRNNKERTVTYTGGVGTPSVKNGVTATYIGGKQSKAVYDAEAKPREARRNAAETQQSTGREVGDISALGAGNYGADKRIFGDGYNVGQGLAKAGQIGLTQIAKAGSSAGAWLENQLGNFAREGTNGYWDPDTSKWLFNRWNQAIDAEAQGVQQRYAENTQRGGRAAEVFEDMAAATVAAIPQAGAAFLTGGASAATQAGALAERAAATPGLVGTISRGMRAMAKDPNFQLSFVQVFGPGYEQAKADGADDLRASLYAVGNGLMNAAVEVGGGIQTLPKELQTGGNAWKSWVDSMLDEGKEEVVQGVIERAMQNTVYGRDNPYIGVGNGAIFDPAAAAEEFAGGAVVGGLLGGGQIGLNTLANRAAYNAEKAQYDRDVRQNTAPEMDSKAAQAVDAVTRGESITGNQAAAIAKNPVAVETLEANTGVKLNTQQPISQLKRDIAALASRDTTQKQPQGTTATPVTQRRAQKPTGGFLEAGQKAYQEMSRTAEDVPTLYAGFSSVYNAGLNGIEASKAKGAYASMLTPEQRYAAYNAGLEDAAAQVARENAEVKSVTTTAGAGLADNVYSRVVIAKSKRTAATLNAMGKKLGVRIEFVDSVMGGQANGQYIRDKNLIQIAVDSNKPYLNVAAHEVTHRMQDLSPAEYRKFRQAAMEHLMREKGIDEITEVVEWYREKAENSSVTLTLDEVMDEIAADFAGNMMENPDLFREFSQSNRTAAQKLLDSLKEFIAKVKSIFTGKARDVAAQEAYGKDFAELEAVAQKWQEAFDAAEQQAERAKTAAGEGDGRMMLKDYSYDALVRKPDMTLAVVEDADGLTRKEVVDKALAEAKKYGGVNQNGNVYVHVNDTDADVIISAKALRHGLDRRFAVNAPATLKVGEILQNAVRVNELVPKLDTVDATYVLMGAAKNKNNEPYIVQFVVNRASNEVMSVDVLYAINAKTEPAGSLSPEITGVPATLTGSSISISDLLTYVNRYFPDVLPESVLRHFGHRERPAGKLGEGALFSLKATDSTGRNLSEQQQAFFKDSKVRDADGRLRPMYQGGAGGFTVFDRKKSKGSNLYGRGFYFTDSKTHAGQYGNNVREFYLNITNPVPTTETTITRAQMRRFLAAVAENEDDFSFENYGYGATIDSVLRSIYGKSDFLMLNDVNQTAIGDMVAAVELFNEINGTNYDGLIMDTETVAFRSEQIKNVDNLNPTSNPDIRYQLRSTADIEQLKKAGVPIKESGRVKTAAGDGNGARYMIRNVGGETMTVIDTENDTRDFKAAEAYLKTLVDADHPFSTILADAQPVYVGKDLPGEYKSSEYTKTMKPALRKIKMQAATNLDEMLLLAENGEWRENVKPKHSKDAQNGWYRYDTQFAVPILNAKKAIDHYTVYGGALLIRNDADGKSYLYDLLDVEKKKVISKTSFSAETHSEVTSPKPSDTSILTDGGNVNRKFQLRSTADIEQEMRDLKRERTVLASRNRALEQRVQDLKGEMRISKEPSVVLRDVKRLGLDTIRRYDSDVKYADIQTDMEALGNAVMKKDVSMSDLMPYAKRVAEKIVDNTAELTENGAELLEIRDYLKRQKILFNGEMDHYNEFRKQHIGTMRLNKTDGTPVDTIYAEMTEMFGEGYFPSDVYTEADKLYRIADVLDGMDAIYQNPFAGYRDAAVQEIANDIIDGMISDQVRQKKTYADRVALEKQEAVGRVREMLYKEREKRKGQIKQLRKEYNEKTQKGREKRYATEMRARIARHTGSISEKLLRPTDKKHIPEELRVVVADLLRNINMESAYSYDENGRLRKSAGGDPTKRTMQAKKLRRLYDDIIDRDGDMVVDPALTEGGGLLASLSDLGDKRIADMSVTELETVWNAIRAIENTLTSYNRTQANEKYAHISEWAEDLAAGSMSRRRRNRKLSLDMADPYTFFSAYGDGGMQIYRTLRNAQDREHVMLTELRDAAKKFLDADVYKNRFERHTFTTSRGVELTLTNEQIMNLYNLAKRGEQAMNHLMVGGIVQPEIKRDGKLKAIPRGTENILLTLEDVRAITSVLTPEQIKVADGLQKLASTKLAEWGNEASMAVYGYRKFMEAHYWPIKTAKEATASSVEKGPDIAREIKNMGSAKALTPNASNALDIGGVYDVFAQNASDMIKYATLLAPMEDINRLYNYRYRDSMGNLTGKNVRQVLSGVYGEAAQSYWRNLMRDVQNGMVKNASATTRAVERIVGNTKGAAVGANLRVVIQQPTAYFRAAVALDPEYMVKGVKKGVTAGNGWDKARRWAPIAGIKDTSGFDQGSRYTIAREVYGTDGGVLEWLNDKSMALAGKADAVTWGKIWNACEWQVASETNLEVGSDAYYRQVAAVFTDVIDQTQVVDGIMQRAQIMRDSDALTRQATSFMGEPLKSLNMFMRAYDAWAYENNPQKRSSALKKLKRSVAALVVTDTVNALAQSIVDGLRDDDKDKNWAERILEAFTGYSGDEENAGEAVKNVVLGGNLISNMNPAGRIPYVKDILSILQGYTVDRMDAAAADDIIRTAKTFIKGLNGDAKTTTAYNLKQVMLMCSKVFGISIGNMGRDMWSIARSIASDTGNVRLMFEMEKAIYRMDKSAGNRKRWCELLYRAQKDNDTETARLIYKEMLEHGYEETDVRQGVEAIMKAEQKVKSVDDLKTRWRAP